MNDCIKCGGNYAHYCRACLNKELERLTRERDEARNLQKGTLRELEIHRLLDSGVEQWVAGFWDDDDLREHWRQHCDRLQPDAERWKEAEEHRMDQMMNEGPEE